MDGLEHLKSSPALQLLKQLDTPLAIATKTAAQYDFMFNAGPLVTAMRMAQQGHSLQNELAQIVRMTIQPQWLSEVASLPTALKAAQQDLARETASMVTAWKSVQQNSAFDATLSERAIDAMTRDCVRDISSMETAWKSARQTWALDPTRLERTIESWSQDLTREAASLATAWEKAQSAWALDTAPIARALQAAEAHNLRIAPAWAAFISLERVNPPSVVSSPTTQIQLPDNSVSNKPLNDYGMAESYDLLSDFERDLRHFINQRMSARFGSEWEKTRLPRNMCKGWQEKREKAVFAGESHGPLIDYADFTDYVIVITQKDNWEQLFKGFFGRPQFVQESLYRLHPIRVCTMHARVLPREMRLVLQSEIMLLSKRMWN